MATPFEEQYMDVLQDIESALVSVYRQHEDMTDYSADKAIDALIRLYRAEETGHPAPATRLQPIDQVAYDQVRHVCEWRLGREKFLDEKGRTVKIDVTPLSLDEIIACLKKVQKSIRYWQKEGGRRGYFFFVERFLP